MMKKALKATLKFLRYHLWTRWKQKWCSKMEATIRTFQSKQGDCIFFITEGNDSRFVVMIDCGKYTDEIKKYVEEDWESISTYL